MHVSTAVDEKSDKSFTLQCLTVLKQFAVDAPQHMLARQDYVRMMWMMLQCEKPDDFVVATNKLGCLASTFLVIQPGERTQKPSMNHS